MNDRITQTVSLGDHALHIGREGAEEFVREFCRGRTVALVTDGQAYALSGAAAFFDPLLPEFK